MSAKFFLILLHPIFVFAQSNTCIDWFEKSKIKRGENCEKDCATLKTDLGTFMCPDECEDLCSPISNSNQSISYLGLTADELSLIAVQPRQAFVVYQQKSVTQQMIQRNFTVDKPDSESDAFRHFVWSALLFDKLGASTAKKFLEAHEAGSKKSDPGRQMMRKITKRESKQQLN